MLLHRYRTEAAFRDTVDVLASGFGLSVLGTPARTGIVVTTQPGSVFAIRTSDLRSTTMTPDDKLVAGLITLAIAAYAFPHARDLDSTDVKIIEVVALDTFIRSAVERVTATTGDDGNDAQARRAADVYDRMNAYAPKANQPGPAKGCTQWAIVEVLGWLVDRGAARPAPTMGATTYQLTDRFRLLVADIGGGEALEALRHARRDMKTA
ncbi:hypothetical protein [Micromonospora sp. DH14]|uniref:hypothetical protein n=1 Tax=Micromonospora sp. DH14 TaxID=3040120 RepID=UPI0024432F1C|nr:hypothetical protein [Micromonospora sp. DH14]MDG9674845.1 hypothetical protein [Micromonospora sp. DH14]